MMPVSQTVTFGDSSSIGDLEVVTITIINDDVVESEESIVVQGSEASAVASFRPSQTQINIMDNDGALWWQSSYIEVAPASCGEG